MKAFCFSATLILTAMTLAACGTDAEYAAGRCAGMGHATGSTAHSDCVKGQLSAIEGDRDFMARRMSKTMYGGR
jgi:hypothetical protein